MAISIPMWIPLTVVLTPVIAITSLIGLIRARHAYYADDVEVAFSGFGVVVLLWVQVIWSCLIALSEFAVVTITLATGQLPL